MDLKEKVIETFRTIVDPEVQENVWDLKLILDLQVDENSGDISFKFRPTVPNCPIGIQLALNIKMILKGMDGIGKIDMTVVDFEMADEANEYLKSF